MPFVKIALRHFAPCKEKRKAEHANFTFWRDTDGRRYHDYLPLFVILREGARLDETRKAKIKHALRTGTSPHHIPDEIIAILEVPLTLTDKKTEVPVKKLLMGVPAEQALSMDALRNPQAMQPFLALARQRMLSRGANHA